MAKSRSQRLSDVVDALRGCNDIDSVLHNPLAKDYMRRYQTSALHLACHMSSIKLVTKFLEQRGDVNIKSGDGTYPIHIVCSNVGYDSLNVRILEIFIKYNANLDVQDSEGQTPVMLACYSNRASIVQTLTQAGCNVNIPDYNNTTVFRLACHFASQGWYFWNVDCYNDRHGFLEPNNFPAYLICKALLNAGANPKSSTLLPSAILYGSEEIVKEFIDGGMDVNYMDEYRRTPLGCACSTSHVPLSTVKLLLDSGANVNIGVHRKSKPIFLAFVHDYLDKMKLLISYGATLDDEDVSELAAVRLARTSRQNPETLHEDRDELLSWKLLVKAGFIPKQHNWEWRLKQLSSCSTYPKAVKVIDQLVFPINSLSDACRISIRSQISPCIDPKVDDLPLPNCLKKFLQFDEFSLQEEEDDDDDDDDDDD